MSQGGGGGIRYDAMIVREYEVNGEARSSWMRAGTAFVNRDGSIGIALDMIPTDWTRAKIILQVPKTKEEIEQLKSEKMHGSRPQHPQRRGPSQPQQTSFQPPQARAPRAPKKTPDYPPQWDDDAAAGQEAPGFADEDQP